MWRKNKILGEMIWIKTHGSQFYCLLKGKDTVFLLHLVRKECHIQCIWYTNHKDIQNITLVRGNESSRLHTEEHWKHTLTHWSFLQGWWWWWWHTAAGLCSCVLCQQINEKTLLRNRFLFHTLHNEISWRPNIWLMYIHIGNMLCI